MSNNTNWISITSVIYIFFSGWGNGFILDLGSRQLRRLCPNWAKGETSKVCCWSRWYPFWAWRQQQSLVSSRENKISTCKRHVNFFLAPSTSRALRELSKTFMNITNRSHIVKTKDSSRPEQCKKLPGINTPFIMLGRTGSGTAWHIEDMKFFSVNYLHDGEPKYWVM